MDAQALGRYLRQSREAKELTLEDAERVLHIRRRILESFELGDFAIPDSSDVQIRGFIRNYARYLGVDEARMVQYYDAAHSNAGRGGQQRGGKYGDKQKKRETQPVPLVAARSITDTDPALPVVQPAALYEQGRRGGGIITILLRLLVGGAALAVIVFVLVQLTQRQNIPELPNVPSSDILGQLPPSATHTLVPTFTPGILVPTALPLAEQQGFTGQGVLVTLETTQRTWLSITTDGVEQYAGIATPGTRIEIPAQNTVAVRASNAEALSIIWNGQEQGTFGGRGQMVDVLFTPSNEEISSGPSFAPTSPFTPTPLPTSAVDVEAAIEAMTPTITPGPSPTPTLTPVPTDTPTITPTPSDTPTITLTPTETLTPSKTPTPTLTPTLTYTPTLTRTPTITPSPTLTLTPSPTAILPPRITPNNPTPTKDGA
jgi:hypothetical protein